MFGVLRHGALEIQQRQEQDSFEPGSHKLKERPSLKYKRAYFVTGAPPTV